MTPDVRVPWMEEIRERVRRTWPEARANEVASERRTLLAARKTPGAPFREAAVLVPLFVKDRELWTLFTKRTDAVEHHKGQISFPGGGRQAADETLWHTALRESEEEIGVPAGAVRPLGRLPHLVTVTDFDVAPFVGAFPWPLSLRAQEGEVEEILEIPVSYLLNPRVVEEVPIEWNGRTVSTLVYHYAGHAIWGATARILADFLEALTEARDA